MLARTSSLMDLPSLPQRRSWSLFLARFLCHITTSRGLRSAAAATLAPVQTLQTTSQWSVLLLPVLSLSAPLPSSPSPQSRRPRLPQRPRRRTSPRSPRRLTPPASPPALRRLMPHRPPLLLHLPRPLLPLRTASRSPRMVAVAALPDRLAWVALSETAARRRASVDERHDTVPVGASLGLVTAESKM